MSLCERRANDSKEGFIMDPDDTLLPDVPELGNPDDLRVENFSDDTPMLDHSIIGNGE